MLFAETFFAFCERAFEISGVDGLFGDGCHVPADFRHQAIDFIANSLQFEFDGDFVLHGLSHLRTKRGADS